MVVQIAVNLPVKDLDRAVEFFTRLGFSLDPQLSSDTTAHLLIGDSVSTMLVKEELFQGMSGRAVADPATSAEVLLQLRLDSREHVDQLVDAALAAGGRAANPTNDRGFLYGRSFIDLDGHLWDAFHVDPSAFLPPTSEGAHR